MKDRITEIELKMEYSKVVDIAKEWVRETKFAVFETTDKRVLYKQNQGLSGTQWISIEGIGAQTKLSAWFAPKNLSPDQNGSFWKGNKQPIPIGLGIGPVGRFKKQYNNLLELLGGQSNSTIQQANQPTLSKDNFFKGFVVLAIIILITGVLNIYNGLNPMSNQLFPDFSKASLQNGIVDLIVAAVIFTSARLLKNGKSLSIWLYGATILFSVGQDISRGADFPIFTVIFGIWVISQLLGLKKQGQLV